MACTHRAVGASGQISPTWPHWRRKGGNRSIWILSPQTTRKSTTSLNDPFAPQSAGPHGHGYAPRADCESVRRLRVATPGRSADLCSLWPGGPGPRSGTTPMKIIAIITDREEVRKILKHLINTGKPPPGLRVATRARTGAPPGRSIIAELNCLLPLTLATPAPSASPRAPIDSFSDLREQEKPPRGASPRSCPSPCLHHCSPRDHLHGFASAS